MSVFVIRPDAPVPETVLRSTLLSLAILRTSGEERTRSPSVGTVAGAGVVGCAAAGSDVLGAGTVAGAAAFPAAPPMTATTVLIVTVEPSGTLISERTPATGEGISASTLSVEISKIGSSRWTLSPTFLSHLVMVPSVMDSPICGIRTSVAEPPVAAGALATGAAAGAAGV